MPKIDDFLQSLHISCNFYSESITFFIDYLQDQLNARNEKVHSLEEYVHELELKLSDMDHLDVKIGQLQQELSKSDSECLLLTKELESKEVELLKSILSIEKLEESISSLSLDSQCEIESMKLDIMALEQACCEANENQQGTILEMERMDGLIQELEIRVHDAERIIKRLELENKELREKLVASEVNGRHFLQTVHEWIESKDKNMLNPEPSSSDMESTIMPTKASACGETLGEFFSKLSILLGPGSNFRKQMERMSDQIREYEVLLKQLKEDLRKEKLKGKEEAEDLTQEMAELRYQMTSLLEEECKRRACIEQASLQRIAELEAQIQQRREEAFSAVRHVHEV
ncbi:myosin heavy chain-related [Euphorbia peplus]|nr:myosin heavy chain-related [Euphorbia peplus]